MMDNNWTVRQVMFDGIQYIELCQEGIILSIAMHRNPNIYSCIHLTALTITYNENKIDWL